MYYLHSERVCVGMLTEYPKRRENLGNGSVKEWTRLKTCLLRENGSVVLAGFIKLKTFRLTITHFSFVTDLDKNNKHSSLCLSSFDTVFCLPSFVWNVELTFTLRAHHHQVNSKFITSERKRSGFRHTITGRFSLGI